MDNYEKIAEGVVVNRIRSSWIELYKLYNDQAAEKGVSLLSRILKAMEKKGAIYKRKDKSDKRKVYICLTDYGLELRDLAAQRLFSFEKAIHENVDSKDIEAFFRVMNKIPFVVDVIKNKV